MVEEKLYTRKEVRKLLKKQIEASANSYGKMECPKALMFSPDYEEENLKTIKRLHRVRLIKF